MGCEIMKLRGKRGDANGVFKNTVRQEKNGDQLLDFHVDLYIKWNMKWHVDGILWDTPWQFVQFAMENQDKM